MQPPPAEEPSASGVAASPRAAARRPPGAVALRAIAAFKLVKAVGLVAVGVGLLGYLSHEQHAAARGVVDQVHPDRHNWLVHELISKVRLMSPATLKAVSAGTFVYAALYAVEGVGLLRRRRWAERMVVVTTGGLMPVELYELAMKFTALRVAILAVNVATVAYLVWQLRRTRKGAEAEPGTPAGGSADVPAPAAALALEADG